MSRFTVILGIVLLALPTSARPDSVTGACAPSVPSSDFRYRFGLAPGNTSYSDLVGLIENPTPFIVEAKPAGPDDPAETILITETHAVYPVKPDSILRVLKDYDDLPQIVPDLVLDETICERGSEMVKQRQRTEFRVLFFTFGTEYLIDAYHVLNGPDEYGGYWGMYESVDGKLAYQYGSWYFRRIWLGGREYTYARHYIYSGVTTHVPGLRFVAQHNARTRVIEMFDALYQEAVSRYGTTPGTSAR